MLAALAEPTRLRIVYHLARKPHHVSELAELIGIPMVNLSHHLGVMRQAGLLRDEKEGRRVVYSFRSEIFEPSNNTEDLGVLKIGPFQIYVRSEPVLPPTAKSRRKNSGK
jgi:DNA-binding transcriptional ArsR family regulator